MLPINKHTEEKLINKDMNDKILIEQGSDGVVTIGTDGSVKSVKVTFNSNTTINSMEIEFFEK